MIMIRLSYEYRLLLELNSFKNISNKDGHKFSMKLNWSWYKRWIKNGLFRRDDSQIFPCADRSRVKCMFQHVIEANRSANVTRKKMKEC